MSDAKLIRVVRSDGTVEHDWKANLEYTDDEGVRRVAITKEMYPLTGMNETLVKRPEKLLFDHWQKGGMARSSEELCRFAHVPEATKKRWMEDADGQR